MPDPDGGAPDLREHPDRLRWNARYDGAPPAFEPHPLVAASLREGLPDGPVLELACGRSGSALELAEHGHTVVAVDVSDLALEQLSDEVERRGLGERVRCVQADVPAYDPGRESFALVLATLYWDAEVYRRACDAVRPGGLIGWEALAPVDEPSPFRVEHGRLGKLLPAGYAVLLEEKAGSGGRPSTRLLARRV